MHAKSWDHGCLAGAEVWPWSKPGQSNPLLFSFDSGLILGGLSFGDRRLRHQSELGVSSCSANWQSLLVFGGSCIVGFVRMLLLRGSLNLSLSAILRILD